MGLLALTAGAAMHGLGVERIDAVAGMGYHAGDDIVACEAVIARMTARLAKRPGILNIRESRVEYPFGSIKQWMNQGAFLMRGLDEVRTEFSLTALAYDLRRAISLSRRGGVDPGGTGLTYRHHARYDPVRYVYRPHSAHGGTRYRLCATLPRSTSANPTTNEFPDGLDWIPENVTRPVDLQSRRGFPTVKTCHPLIVQPPGSSLRRTGGCPHQKRARTAPRMLRGVPG